MNIKINTCLSELPLVCFDGSGVSSFNNGSSLFGILTEIINLEPIIFSALHISELQQRHVTMGDDGKNETMQNT